MEVTRLTNNDLKQMVAEAVEHIIKERQNMNEGRFGRFMKNAAGAAAIGAGGLGMLAGNAMLHDDDYVDPQAEEMRQAERAEFGADALRGKKTADFNKVRRDSIAKTPRISEAQIKRIVSECIKNFNINS